MCLESYRVVPYRTVSYRTVPYRAVPYLVAGKALRGWGILHLVEVRGAVQLRARDGHLPKKYMENVNSNKNLQHKEFPMNHDQNRLF